MAPVKAGKYEFRPDSLVQVREGTVSEKVGIGSRAAG